jgi:hypothetical protein
MMINGKKTYITAVVLGLASFAVAMGWLTNEQYQVIVGLLGSLGLAALRAGVAKSSTADKAQEARQTQIVPVSGTIPVAEGNVSGNR